MYSRRSPVLTFGEGLVSVLPTGPVPIDEADTFKMVVGGAEVNFALVLANERVPVSWIGRVGDDAMGARVLDTLARSGVETRHAVRDSKRPTGLYLREWLLDGARRPYYYRNSAAGVGLCPENWPGDAGPAALIHLTGITAALGVGPQAAIRRIRAWAAEHGVPVSFDPNYRSSLWSRDVARETMLPMLAGLDLLLLGDEEAQLLFGTDDPEEVFNSASQAGVRLCVLKCGARGAYIRDESGMLLHAPALPVRSVDPVGAGDAFNGGFVASWVKGQTLGEALEAGARYGARLVEMVGDALVATDAGQIDALSAG